MDERYGWIALKRVPGIGPVSYKRLLEEIGPPETVFKAPLARLLSVDGINEKVAWEILHFKEKETVVRELERIDAHPVSFIHYFHPQYPVHLKNIHDPPPFFYMMGELWKKDDRSIAVVGTRRPTFYGKQVARELAGDLARAQMTVVSGFAMGIDQIAHRAALDAGGRTIAVLGTGIDIDYPHGSMELKEAISAQGAVITEFPMGTPAAPENFPRRNRLISGLSAGVLVVEAAEKSGSLITAGLALEQGKDVFAVPGSIHSEFSRGSHYLIKCGAKLVEKVSDILEEVDGQFQAAISFSEPPLLQDLPPDEKKIYDILSVEPVHLDDISIQLNWPPHRSSDLLLRLELKGLVSQVGGNQFIRIR
jgi:DNA processing protein